MYIRVADVQYYERPNQRRRKVDERLSFKCVILMSPSSSAGGFVFSWALGLTVFLMCFLCSRI